MIAHRGPMHNHFYIRNTELTWHTITYKVEQAIANEKSVVLTIVPNDCNHSKKCHILFNLALVLPGILLINASVDELFTRYPLLQSLAPSISLSKILLILNNAEKVIFSFDSQEIFLKEITFSINKNPFFIDILFQGKVISSINRHSYLNYERKREKDGGTFCDSTKFFEKCPDLWYDWVEKSSIPHGPMSIGVDVSISMIVT